MSESSDAKKAVDSFVNAFTDASAASRSFLEQQAAAVQQAALKVGEAFASAAMATDPLLAGVTDPFQKSLLEDNFAEIGADVVGESIVEDTGNRLSRIFEEAKAATFHLFETTPDFFYSMTFRSSARYQRVLSAAQAAALDLATAAAAYNAFHQAMSRVDLDALNPSAVIGLKTNLVGALARMDVALAQGKKGVISPAATQSCVTAIQGLCSLFTIPESIIGFLFMGDMLSKIGALDRLVLEVLDQKAQFENAFVSTLEANVVGPITRTFSTVRDQISGSVEQLSSLLTKAVFDKFSALGLGIDLCQRAHIFIQALTMTPEAVKADIEGHVNFGAFNAAISGILAQTDGPATAYQEFSPTYLRTVQSVMIADIRTQLAQRTTEMLGRLTALEAWITAQQVILAALPAVTDAAAAIALDVLGVSALDHADSLVQGSDMAAFAKSSSNTASKAGKAAQAIGIVIQDLPVSQQNKAGALSDVRSALLSIEAAQVIASEAILSETPGAIGDVDSLTLQVNAIKEQAGVLLS